MKVSLLRSYNESFSKKSFSSVHKQTNLVIEEVADKFKGCLLAEWIKMLGEEWDANLQHKHFLQTT